MEGLQAGGDVFAEAGFLAELVEWGSELDRAPLGAWELSGGNPWRCACITCRCSCRLNCVITRFVAGPGSVGGLRHG